MSVWRYFRKTRWRLTAVFGGVMVVSLAGMAVLVVGADFQVQIATASEQLLKRAQEGASVIYFDEGYDLVVETYEASGDLRGGYPQVWVFVATGDIDHPVDLLGEPFEDFLGVEAWELAAAIVVEGEQGIWDFPINNEFGDQIGTAVARGVPVRLPGGEIGGSVVAVADSADWLDPHSELKQQVILIAFAIALAAAAASYFIAGRSLRPARRSLEQQERLIADAAHELRTPVARIRAAAEGGISGDETPSAALQRVARVAEDAGDLLDDLLALARMDAGQQSLDVELLRLDLLAEAVADGYEGVNLETVETVVDGDAGLLRRAIDNLLRNAIQHGGRDPSSVTITVYPSRVIVTDRGPGIHDDDVFRVFERFQTGETSSGHGLGLPIVAWIARAHGGRVSIVNHPERSGAVATFQLPG